MRVKVLILVVLLGVLGAPATSHAEKVRTNAKAKVYNRPGEQGKIIVRVKEGQAMTVLSKEGRWLKVRVSGRTGFIPRSKVDMPGGDDDEIARNTRRRPFVDGRGMKRGFGGSAPDDRIGADATEDHGGGDSEEGGDEADTGGDDEGDDEEKPEKKPKKEPKKEPKVEKKPKKVEKASSDDEDEAEEEGSDEEEPAKEEEEEEEKDLRKRAKVSEKTPAYSDPDKKSDKSFTATPKDTLFVESTKGKWTEVSVEEGDIGWILSSKLEVDGDDDGGGDEGGGSKKRIIDTRARLGFRLISQTLSSAGGAAVWPDRYKIGSSSVAVSLGGMLLFPYKKDFLVGGAIDYDLAYAIPGISFDPDGANGPMPGATTSFIMHNIRVRGVGGYNFHKKNGLVLLAKLGVHYESFLVDNKEDLTKNTARLPSEVIKGPGLGLGVAIPRLTDKIGLTINLDAVLIGGSLTQTKNLEDGANPSVKRYTVSAILNYRYSNGFDLNFGYDMNYASLSFGAPIATSMRMHTGTGVARTDLNHTVSAGVSKAF
jgi:Bacterial SH3 domain